MKRLMTAVAVAGTCVTGTVSAVTPDNYEMPYIGLGAEFVSVDSVRANDDGIGGRFRLGLPLAGTPGAVELSFYNNALERDLDGRNDYQTGLFVDYVYDLSGLVGDIGVKPFVLAGAGFAEDDILANNDLHPGINAGGGVLVPLALPFAQGFALRAEARFMGQFNDEHYADDDFVSDVRINLGVQVPLSWHFQAQGEPVAEQDCELAVVDTTTGRTDCVVDTDQDGVIDAKDDCPGTPRGAVVNSSGCVLAQVRDGDGDGVTDTFDRCPDSPAGVKVDESGCEIAEVVILRGVTFETASSTLTANAETVLDRQITKLKQARATLIEVAGHTDSRGAAEYNLELSQARAQSVVDYLVANGIPASRLTAQGYGEYEPIASNDTQDGREQNRRVELRTIAE